MSLNASIIAATIPAIWEHVDRINSALNDAYGSGIGGHYGTALLCAGEAINAYMELIELCKNTKEQPLREVLRDAVGSVKLDKFELPIGLRLALDKAANEAVNPGFHSDPIFPKGIQAENDTIIYNNKYYVKEGNRYVYDADVNYAVRKDLVPNFD